MKNTTFNRSRLASAVSVALAVSGMAVALPAAAQEEAEVMEALEIELLAKHGIQNPYER